MTIESKSQTVWVVQHESYDTEIGGYFTGGVSVFSTKEKAEKYAMHDSPDPEEYIIDADVQTDDS